MKYPSTKREPVADTLHGVKIIDDYRWLENTEAKETKDWVDQQNKLTDLVLSDTGLLDEYKALLENSFDADDISSPVQRGQRYFWYQRLAGEDLPQVYFKDGLDGDPILLIDLSSVREDNAVSLDYWSVSKDGKYIAYGISECGDEMAVLRVKEVNKQKDTGDVIERARYSDVTWLPDSTGFYYDRSPDKGAVPENEEHLHTKIYFHALGQDSMNDKLIFGKDRPMDDMYDNYQLSDDARYLYFNVAKNWNTNAVYRYDSLVDNVQLVLEDGEALAFTTTIGDYVYLHTDHKANNYKFIRTKNDQAELPSIDNWEVVIPESDHQLEYVNLTKDCLLASYLIDAVNKIYLFDYDGRSKKELPVPDNSMAWTIGTKYESDFFLTYTTMNVPKRIMRYDSANDDYVLYWQQDSAYDPEDFRVDKEWAVSKDGTKLPMYILSKKDTPLDQPAPTVLWGYGCHGDSQSLNYMKNWMPWINKGGRFVISIIRGGGEYGEQWHMDGSLKKKQNTFDDFIACADRLKEMSYTSKEKLAIQGGSNGGLMVGAVFTQRPDISKAVICDVPVLDLYRYHKFLIAGRWVHEFGDPEKADEFEWLRKWSPYHHVNKNTQYPSVFFITAENDTRVHPLHAKKMTAIMQATVTNNPVLLRVESKAGHAGGSKPVSKIIEAQAEKIAYVDWQLGLSKN